MLKISLLFKNLQTSRARNSRILRTKNVKFTGYCFYTNRFSNLHQCTFKECDSWKWMSDFDLIEKGFTCVHASACNFIKKETMAQVFSCEFCEIYKNTFSSYRRPPVAASWPARDYSSTFLTYGLWDNSICKYDKYELKNFVLIS